MRILTGLCLSIAISITALAADGADKSPKSGVRIPGVQIPFANLKPEAEFKPAAAPEWILFSDSILLAAKSEDGLERIDLKANKLGDPIPGLSQPCAGIAIAFKSLWIPNCGDRTVARLDPKTGKIDARLPIGAAKARAGVAATSDSVWVLTDEKTTLSRIDPDRNQVVAELRLPAGCSSLVFGEGALWVACPTDNKVLRIDPRTNLVDQRIEVSTQPQSLAIGEGSVWVLCRKDGKVDRIDPKTNKVVRTIDLDVPEADGGIAAGSGSIWVTLTGFPITRIDPATEKVVQQFAGEGGGAVQAGMGSIWLSNLREGTLWRLDPKRIAATLAE